MQKLLDPNGSYLKSEENVKKFLKKLSDEKIQIYYENVELTPFPILLAKEYHNRILKKKQNSKKKNQFQRIRKLTGRKRLKRKRSSKIRQVPFRHGSGIHFSEIKGR